jgi:iron complex outermembrane recepter protein
MGFRANIGTGAAGRIFDPETTRLIEGRAKRSLLDGTLTGTLAVFQMDKTNVLATDTVNIGFLVAIGKARSRGAEVDLTGRLPGNLELRLSYAYVDAEARSAVIDPNSVQIASGDSLLNIQRHTVNVQLAHDMAIGAVTGRIRIGLQHVGTRLGETGTAFTLPSHTLVRLFARANLTKNIEVFGEVQNLFNRRWFANSYSTLWVQPGAPRTASIGVRTRF